MFYVKLLIEVTLKKENILYTWGHVLEKRLLLLYKYYIQFWASHTIRITLPYPSFVLHYDA